MRLPNLTLRLSNLTSLTPLTLAIAVAGTHLLLACVLQGKERDRPNIILIMSDDMGYSDIGCYGSEVETPNLDALAAEGVRFTQFYNTARCCPTRACLLTGLYPHQAGVGWMMTDRGYPGYEGDLNNKCVTIAQVLGASGYRCYMSGKWHVTPKIQPDADKSNWPLQRGFDRFYGTIHGAGSFFDPNSLTRDNEQISPYDDAEYTPQQYYYTDAISDHAVRFVAEHEQDHADAPFFMYVAYTAAHWPMHALPQDIAKYKGKYDAGYEAIRKARFAKMKKLGVIKEDCKLSPQARDWAAVKHEAWELRNMEVYAAMIDNMDQGIGRLVRQLEKDGQLDNTLIMFFQDNGGCAEGLGRQPRGKFSKRPEKAPFDAMAKGELQTAMIPKQTRDGFPLIMGPGAMPGPADTYIAYGQGWANVSNTPFREYKHWVHEGGISSPLIVHWPAKIKDHGQLRHQPAHLIDMMATCVDVSGAKYPQKHDDHAIRPMEGKSLAATCIDNSAIDRDAIYWEHEGNRAIRVGDWKLVAKGEKGPWELYDIASDRAELIDLADSQPDRTKKMADMWQAWAKRADVLPLGAWRGNFKKN